ncbi:MAG TPA: coenzyme F420-0:L-glutamate ligase [Candidatus Paceibacterota bacterium]|nr:coenzyme F420-0:L-glutamate ligase [Candidatus Paceibacterota bacterium]
MKVDPIKTRVFREGEELLAFIREHVKKLPEDSVLVVTSKIVALAEKRTVVIKDDKTRERTIKAESDFAIRTPYTWLTLKDGLLMSSAGVDESNADGKIILLPKDSYHAAAKLRRDLMKAYRVKRLGVLIPDSRVLPLRQGAVGVAMGYAGFKGIRDYRGTPDIFGRLLKISRTNTPDGLASAAVLVMGEGNERQPLALITNAPVEFIDRITKGEVMIPPEDDMYRPFFDALPSMRRTLKRGQITRATTKKRR